MPNSCTVTPARRATTKWPNSCMTTSTTRMARRITTSRKPFPIPVSSSGITASRRLSELCGFGPGADSRVQGDQLVQIRSLWLPGSEPLHGVATELGDTGEGETAVEETIHRHIVGRDERSAGSRSLSAGFSADRQRGKALVVDRLEAEVG